MIKFNKHHVTDGTTKARCHYSLDNRGDGRSAVTIYAKDYDRALGRMFAGEYTNNSDSMTDYFEKGRVVLFADHPLYAAARTRAEAEKVHSDQRAAAYHAKLDARRAAWAVTDTNSVSHPCHY